MLSNSFADHCREIARRFLLTAVVVDDELSFHADQPVQGDLKVPGQGVSGRHGPTSVDPQRHPPRSLKVDPITWSFASQGMVCGVVSPQEGQNGLDALAKAVARADIVILDWRLSRTTGADALPLLKRILTEDQPHRLRLIAFYTGERDHEAIRDKIVDGLNNLHASDQGGSIGDAQPGRIDYGACRIVVYGKPGSLAPKTTSVVKEVALADRLIAEFADMVEGLLPSLVLTALAAVRDNAHRVLERFGGDLDPAFLAHRACLPQPQESEQHIVEQIASELHGIMDDVIGRESPAGIEAIERWFADRVGNDKVSFSDKHEAAVPTVLKMLRDGLKDHPGPLGLKNYLHLSHGFSGGADNSRELDRRLASTKSFRQVVADTERQLSIGTVVRRVGDLSTTLLCVTPRCDSVRLTGKSSFLFLPLSDPKSNTPQVVVPTGDNQHQRMTISMNPSQWCMEDFNPDPDRQCVLAHLSGPGQAFSFKDVSGKEYRWVGELKAEFAQSIAQAIAARMSRLPLNKSEWHRRSERVGKRND